MGDERPVKRPRGRPSKLRSPLDGELLVLLCSGCSVTESARRLGITRRSISHWRRRAYSTDPKDAPFVAFEQRLQRTLLDAARAERQQHGDDYVDFGLDATARR